jgi:exosortase/archaeosortase family protein
VYGYFIDRRWWVRLLLAASTVPVAICTNALRVAGTGIAAQYYGPGAAEGFLHEFSGLIIFAAAFAMIFVTAKVMQKIWPPRETLAGKATAAA